MELRYLYTPVVDLARAVAFYGDQLQLEEAWREDTGTVAFWLPNRVAQIMCSVTEQPAGPMYLVDSLEVWISDHPDLEITIEKYDITGGSVAGFGAPDGNTFYVFDQPNA